MDEAGSGSAERRAQPRRPPAPHVRLELDDLLSQLVDRAQEVMRTRDRLRGLLGANQAVASEVSLPVVLRRIVESASALVGARYAALGVIGPDRLTEFIHVGLDEESVQRIGPLPRGDGILGLLVQDPRPLRLRDLGEHVQSVGFPPEHPPMRSFLGVPIRVHDRVFGNLYLTEKRGAEEFTQEDEELLEALAAAAAVAIDNAAMFDQTRRRQVWQQAATRITTELLSGATGQQALALVARDAREVSGADAALVAVPDQDGCFSVRATEGTGTAHWRGQRLPSGSDAVLAVREGRALLLTDPGKGDDLPALVKEDEELTSVLLVPMRAGGETRGVLALMTRGTTAAVDLSADTEPLTGFAAQAALAIELGDNRGAREQLTLLEDRERIARDLHDQVIQRLFAVGLGLQSLSGRTPPAVGGRLLGFVDDLDDTIREVRATIFELQRDVELSYTRAQVLDVVAEASAALGFDPRVQLDGPVDSLVTGALAGELLAVLREALSNVARHAAATQVEVAVRAGVQSGVELVVADDGVGLGRPSRSSGLRNMAERAAALGGSFLAEGAPGAGTRITWSVPLPAAESGR